MKKYCLAIALVALLALVGCAEHEHSWNSGVVTKDATCTEKGEMTYTCVVCEATRTEEIDAIGHKWDSGVVSAEPKCTEEGKEIFTCTVCKETKTEGISATDHTPGEDFKCSGCGQYFYPSVEVMNKKATRENIAGKTITVEVGTQCFTENTYWETSSGLGTDVLSFFIGSKNLNYYNAPAMADDERPIFIFKDGEITTSSTGYKSIDNHSDDKVYMLLPANSDVVFENVTFKGVVCFDVQEFSAGWDVLNSITFKNCTFNGIIIGSCPADNIVFDECHFKNYTNSEEANSSNPIWMRPIVGSWTNGTGPHVSMHSITFKNNEVTSSRPVKFEFVGVPYTENGTQKYYDVNIEILDNNFDISKENSANNEGEFKNVGIYIGKYDDNVKFTLVDDGNKISEGTKALYTFVSEKFAEGTKILDRNNAEKTIEYVTWKTGVKHTLESK